MKYIFCFLEPDEYGEKVADIIVYEQGSLERDEEADCCEISDVVPHGLVYETMEFCYDFMENVTEQQVREQFVAAGLVEVPELKHQVDELPLG